MLRFTVAALFAAALMIAGPAAHAQITYSTNIGGSIPDNDPVGISSTINVDDAFNLGQVKSLTITGFQHTFINDLLVTLSHNGTTVEIIDAVGGPSNLNGDYTFVPSGGADIDAAGNQGDDTIIDPSSAYNTRTSGTGGGEGPTEYSDINGSLRDFHGMNVNGGWVLNISDHAGGDVGSFTGWSFVVTSGVLAPEPASLILLLPGVALFLLRHRRIAH